MKYSDLKNRVKLLKKFGYHKEKGQEYERLFVYSGLGCKVCVSRKDIFFSENSLDNVENLQAKLEYAEEKAINSIVNMVKMDIDMSLRTNI